MLLSYLTLFEYLLLKIITNDNIFNKYTNLSPNCQCVSFASDLHSIDDINYYKQVL